MAREPRACNRSDRAHKPRQERPRRQRLTVFPARNAQLGERLHQIIGVHQLPLERHPRQPVAHPELPAGRRAPPHSRLRAAPQPTTRSGHLPGGRNPVTDSPSDPNARTHRSRIDRSRAAERPPHCSWRQPCIPSSWPRAAIDRTASGYSSQLIASTKNVARRPHASRVVQQPRERLGDRGVQRLPKTAARHVRARSPRRGCRM